MPATFPAHQGLIVGLKLRWPQQMDATALCMGAAAPDLAYPMGPWLNGQSHTAIGLVLWSVPVAVMAAVVMRRFAAAGIFACLPDLGPLRLRSYRVLSNRSPAPVLTVGSAALGAFSHVLIDGFTHAGRWGANWLGLNDVVLSVPLRGEMTWARLLQYLGHIGGTVAFLVVLLIVGSRGRLVDWYDAEAVERARSVEATTGQRAILVLVALTPPLLAVLVSGRSTISDVFLAQTVFVPSALAAGAVVARLQRSTTEARPTSSAP